MPFVTIWKASQWPYWVKNYAGYPQLKAACKNSDVAALQEARVHFADTWDLGRVRLLVNDQFVPTRIEAQGESASLWFVPSSSPCFRVLDIEEPPEKKRRAAAAGTACAGDQPEVPPPSGF
eukprot:RCo043143